MKLIDVGELKDWVENWLCKNAYYHPHSNKKSIPVAELYDIVEQMPTVDAVPVIRCKDCKFAPKCYGDIARASKDGGVVHSPLGTNGYCSLAERKEE